MRSSPRPLAGAGLALLALAAGCPAGRYLQAHEHWVQLLELDPCDEAAFVAEQENEERLRREASAEFRPYSWSCVDHPRPTPAPPARP